MEPSILVDSNMVLLISALVKSLLRTAAPVKMEPSILADSNVTPLISALVKLLS